MSNLATNQDQTSRRLADAVKRLGGWLQQQRRSSGDQTPGQQSAAEVNPSDESRDERGPTLGRELPFGVYLTVIGAYAWLLLVSLVAFAKGTEVDLTLGISGVILLLLLGLPAITFHLAWSRSRSETEHRDWYGFMTSKLDTWTGSLPAGEAWVQILIIPGSLALAATMIGLVYWIVV